jgi:glycosyltransferase involved in cell wall biosynthesis
MLITIDGTPLLTEKESGVAKYIKNLIFALSEIDKKNEYTLFFYTSSKERRRIFLEKRDFFIKRGFQCKTLCIPQYGFEILWNKIGLKFPPIEFFSGKTDVFHSPGYRVPLVKRAKVISTIYDLTRLRIKEILPEWLVEHFFHLVKSAISRSDKIIAISENTKKDLVEIFNLPPEKINVVYLGISQKYRPLCNEENIHIQSILRKYSITKPYLLCVATVLAKHKNVETVIKCFEILKNKYDIPHKLVVVGKKGIEYSALYKLVYELKVEKEVIFTDYIPEDELICIYNGADVFVFLSLYEGFGFPPLEAMACGIPVVVSNRSSLPEVVGDAGILVDPFNVEEIVSSIYKIIIDSEFKNTLSRKGLERVKNFSWAKCAKETLDLYLRI